MNDEPQLLAGRYEVGDLIGRGGMAEVHIGYDTRLGRNVAIKILRADLARDPSFQTRFRREAQAAAGLNHPSIVAVYDTGEDHRRNEQGAIQAVPFIVMEYVEGHTVRDILKGDVAAPIDEAVEITQGVLSGLDYAHHAGLVHRDIKPANVMLTPTGAVKVMDFGIARALADVGQTMTQTQAVVGTAQYLSPEQARGENVDARSDLYSTGCLLFELLTGRPPFMGDSPVSVAYQHVREEAPRPSQFASDVPAELDAVVAKALQKDRNARYSSAQEFSADLQRAMGGSPAPTTGATAVGSAAWGVGAAGVAAAGAAAAGSDHDFTPGTDATSIMPGEPAPRPHPPTTGATAVMPASAGWGAVMGGPPGPPPSVSPPVTGTIVTDDELVEDDSRKRLMIQIGIAAAAVIGLILVIWALFSMLGNEGGEPEPTAELVTIPILEGVDRDTAQTRLEALGLTPVFEEELSEEIESGRVIRTDPESGEKVDPATDPEVTVYLSSGPDEIEVPEVRGMTQEDAVTALEDAGLEVSTVEPDHDPDIAADRASKTEPAAGTVVPVDTGITLYISDGKVELPELRGKTEGEAQQLLVELGLIGNLQDVETTEVDPGTVFEQDPLPGLVDQGSTVTIKVAKAPTTVEVPNVVGSSQAQAMSALNNVGLKSSVTEENHLTVPAGQVISQNPSGGIKVAIGTTVNLVVSKGPLPVTTEPAPPGP
ncbi:Stk1 family PASTA domain-containing Ser/Thr kinase [Demequina sp. TTPB684]|nr:MULTISPECIES: Stk1 family PASTA domain-containing Ser/Thr kinase [unclassified Demequina]MCB2412628.1 Stk1 family PASTA domain-containing Ser/Thr kinase [Demequina sp. TTPB684]